jgi:hypothetical protein
MEFSSQVITQVHELIWTLTQVTLRLLLDEWSAWMQCRRGPIATARDRVVLVCAVAQSVTDGGVCLPDHLLRHCNQPLGRSRYA